MLVEPPTVDTRPYGVGLSRRALLLRSIQLESHRPAPIRDVVTPAINLCPTRSAPAPNRDRQARHRVVRRLHPRLLGRLDPKTGKVEEFASPGGAQPRPYAIDVTSDGVVWYARPASTQERAGPLQPDDEDIPTWAIPSGGGTVRNMVIDKKGDSGSPKAGSENRARHHQADVRNAVVIQAPVAEGRPSRPDAVRPPEGRRLAQRAVSSDRKNGAALRP